MKRMIAVFAAVLLLLCGCDMSATVTERMVSSTTKITATTTVVTTTALTTTTVTQPSLDMFLSLDGIPTDHVFEWFKEVCLDAEFSDDGDSSLVQKWMTPIRYTVKGTPTTDDIVFLEKICDTLNTVEGFAGIAKADEPDLSNLEISFCSGEELVDMLGDPFTTDYYGGTRFWYDNNAIYRSVICVRNDIDQQTRNTVIVEEMYNQLGPVQDTQTREDSVIYQYSNENDTMSPVDMLILQLLYHPDIKCGMTADDCERVINDLIEKQIAWAAQTNT